jgi:hypothetical protein
MAQLNLYQTNRFRGYDISRTTLFETAFEQPGGGAVTANAGTPTFVGYVDVSEDQILRIGQGEYDDNDAPGTLSMTLDNGSGSEPGDQATIVLRVYSGQNNPGKKIVSFPYRKVKNGVELPELGNPVVGNPKRVGMEVQAASGTYSVDLGASEVAIDAMEGEK